MNDAISKGMPLKTQLDINEMNILPMKAKTYSDGRIYIPLNIRKMLRLKPGVELEVYLTDTGIFLCCPEKEEEENENAAMQSTD